MSRRFPRTRAFSRRRFRSDTRCSLPPAIADPVVLLQHDDEHLSITATRDGDQIEFDITNVGTQTEKIGLGALSVRPGRDRAAVARAVPSQDQFQADIEPGERRTRRRRRSGRARLAVIYRERDTAAGRGRDVHDRAATGCNS